MASTDSTIPDTVTGDSAGSQAGQSFTDKAKSVLKGNIPTTGNKNTEQSAEKEIKERMDQGVGDTGSSTTQNTLV